MSWVRDKLWGVLREVVSKHGQLPNNACVNNVWAAHDFAWMKKCAYIIATWKAAARVDMCICELYIGVCQQSTSSAHDRYGWNFRGDTKFHWKKSWKKWMPGIFIWNDRKHNHVIIIMLWKGKNVQFFILHNLDSKTVKENRK